MINITDNLRSARNMLIALGYNDQDPEVHAINVCILERFGPPHDVKYGEPLSLYVEKETDYEQVCLVLQSEVRAMVCQEWHAIVKEYGLKPGTTVEQLVGRLLARIDGK